MMNSQSETLLIFNSSWKRQCGKLLKPYFVTQVFIWSIFPVSHEKKSCVEGIFELINCTCQEERDSYATFLSSICFHPWTLSIHVCSGKIRISLSPDIFYLSPILVYIAVYKILTQYFLLLLTNHFSMLSYSELFTFILIRLARSAYAFYFHTQS